MFEWNISSWVGSAGPLSVTLPPLRKWTYITEKYYVDVLEYLQLDVIIFIPHKQAFMALLCSWQSLLIDLFPNFRL